MIKNNIIKQCRVKITEIIQQNIKLMNKEIHTQIIHKKIKKVLN